ncbi:MAG: pyruvate kinase [Gammaproteobacteria bacterium]|nr:pyruvate kinase [Gammaproteobacteria bacterium]
MRRTKIVATLGPATDDLDVLYEMCRSGLDVARLNFSHGTHEEHLRRLELLREASLRAGRYVGVLADLAGPKIRIESFTDGKVELKEGATFALDTAHDPRHGNEHVVGVAYADLPRDVHAGDTLYLNDGLIVLEVQQVKGTRIECRVVVGGELSNRKGLNRKGGGISAPALTDKDRADIRFIAANKIDYVALSFVRDAEDVREARALVRAAGGDLRVIAKIERHESVENLDELIRVSDGLMVARGDLGVEMGYAEITGLQKTIIERTRAGNRVVITATQMMESMVHSPVPTRAEVSDVANAVMDGTDAVMLSAETATGKYPVKAVQAMADVIEGAEKYQTSHFGRAALRTDREFENTEEAIAMAVMYTASHMNVKAIVALTESGATPLWMSRIRSDIPIYAFTRHEATRRRVTLYRGVYPIPFDMVTAEPRKLYGSIFALLLDLGLVDTGDLVILTKGELSGVSGGTNSLQILAVTRD